jgi:sugar phosphate isomerase/epimerase
MVSSNNFRLSIVLSTHPSQFKALAFKGEFESNIAKIAGWGYNGVELAIRDPDLVDVNTLERILEVHGLKVPAIGTGQAWGEEQLSFTNPDLEIRNAAVMRIKRQIQLAHRFNALVIIGLIRGVTPTGQTQLQSRGFLTQCLQECLEVASAQGVCLALEPINRYETDLIHTTSDGLELIHQIGSSNLGLLLDTFHMNIEEASIEESIRMCGKHVLHFHVADSNRKYPGAGHLNFTTIFNALLSTGYQGWISGEFMPDPDPDAAAQGSITYLREIGISRCTWRPKC